MSFQPNASSKRFLFYVAGERERARHPKRAGGDGGHSLWQLFQSQMNPVKNELHLCSDVGCISKGTHGCCGSEMLGRGWDTVAGAAGPLAHLHWPHDLGGLYPWRNQALLHQCGQRGCVRPQEGGMQKALGDTKSSGAGACAGGRGGPVLQPLALLTG